MSKSNLPIKTNKFINYNSRLNNFYFLNPLQINILIKFTSNSYIYLFHTNLKYMSATKSRSPYFYSPLKVQSDQKEIIIAHLKEEIYLLRKNEDQLRILEQQYHDLDHKYRYLSEEKAINDADFKERHELALRNISDLKHQIDALRAEIRDRHLELNDLEADQNTLRNQLDQRLIDIERLKNDLTSLLADNESLLNEKIKLEEIASSVRRDNQALISNLKNTEIDNESVKRKIDDLEKYLSQLRTQDALLKDKILSYENQNNQLDADINATIEDLTALDNEINNSNNDIIALQGDIASITALADKHKSESIHYQRAAQNEVMKNNDLAKNIGQAENILRVRINQVEQGRKEVATLHGENQGLNKVNNRLQDDLELCRKHLENLAMMNNDLVINLERYSQEDEIVRNLIDRRNRVIRAQARVDEVSKMNFTRVTISSTGYGSGYSPARKSKLAY